MLSIRLSKEVEKHIDQVSSKMHMTRAAFLREAIMEHLEDMDDYFTALDTLKEMETLEANGQKSTYTFDEIKEIYQNDF